MVSVIETTQNTVYVRKSFGVSGFEWAGRCAKVDRLVTDLGAMNPTFCQGVDGGLVVTGHTDGTPGLLTTTVIFKEQQVKSVGEKLQSCLWDVDRRYHCKNLPMWNAWEKIERAAAGRATSIDMGGSSYDEDSEELATSLPWSAVSRCTIRRVSLSVNTFGGEGGA